VGSSPDFPNLYFFLGKGGVGKTTLASLTALALARQGPGLLVSLDPAHNLGDVWEHDFSRTPRQIVSNLWIAEADLAYWIEKSLRQTEKRLQQSYAHTTTLNLEKHFGVLRHSPGLEEYGLLLAFSDYLEKHKSLRWLVIDLPPTALATRFFSLPQSSLIWLSKLQKLRQEILQRKQILTRIQLGHHSWETDKVSKILKEQQDFNEHLLQAFTNAASHRFIVTNPDHLSQAESLRLTATLARLRLTPVWVILNKAPQEASVQIQEKLKPLIGAWIPLAEGELRGLPQLHNFLSQTPQLEALLEKSTNVSQNGHH